MKRFHIHVSVKNLELSIRFYSTLFAVDPAVRKPDFAKWMLEDPRINFAISTHRQPVGVSHPGFQVDTARNRRRSSASASALAYRWRGSFRKHFRQIVSRLREILGFQRLGAIGSWFNSRSRESSEFSA